MQYREASPTFRADNGFQTRNDYRRVDASQGVSFYEVHPFVDRANFGLDLGRSWNFDGLGKETTVRPDVYLSLKGQTGVYLGYTFADERFRGVEFDGLRRWEASINSNFSEPVSLGFGLYRGDAIARTLETPETGAGTGFSASATLRPTQRLEIRPSYSYEALERADGSELYAGYIVRSRVSYQFTRELFLRLVAQYNDFTGGLDLEPLLMYRLNPFSIIYLGSTHDWRDFDRPEGFASTGRQLFLKVQYLFRR